MATYINVKCGNCGKSITGGYQRGDHSRLGVTHRYCHHCGRYNKTGSKPLSHFNLEDKIYFWFPRVIGGILIGSVFGGALGIGVASWLGFEEYSSATKTAIFVFAGLGVLVYWFFSYLWINFNNKSIEKEQEKLNLLLRLEDPREKITSEDLIDN
jgi:hypothetical protein